MAARLPVAPVATILVIMACLQPLAPALGCTYVDCEDCKYLTGLTQLACYAVCTRSCTDASAVGTEARSAETSLFQEIITKKGGVQLWYCMNGCAAAKQCSQAEGKEASACFMACGNTCANRSALPVSKSVVADA